MAQEDRYGASGFAMYEECTTRAVIVRGSVIRCEWLASILKNLVITYLEATFTPSLSTLTIPTVWICRGSVNHCKVLHINGRTSNAIWAPSTTGFFLVARSTSACKLFSRIVWSNGRSGGHNNVPMTVRRRSWYHRPKKGPQLDPCE